MVWGMGPSSFFFFFACGYPGLLAPSVENTVVFLHWTAFAPAPHSVVWVWGVCFPAPRPLHGLTLPGPHQCLPFCSLVIGLEIPELPCQRSSFLSLAIPSPLHFHMNFRSGLPMSIEQTDKIFVWSVSSLRTDSGRTDILGTLSLLTYEHGICLHLRRSPLISSQPCSRTSQNTDDVRRDKSDKICVRLIW